MNSEPIKTTCPKCGFRMKSTDRFCMHCGYINFDNTNNEFLEKYDKNAKKIKKKKDEQQQGQFIQNSGQLAVNNNAVQQEAQASTKDINKIKGLLLKINYKVVRTIVLIILFVVLLFAYSYIKDKQEIYVSDAKKIVEVIKTIYEYNDDCINEDVRYFKFKYNDLDSRYGLKMKSPYRNLDYFGYVKVVKNGEYFKYYVSLNDGRFGIRETEVSELTPFKVLPYDSAYDSIKDNSC